MSFADFTDELGADRYVAPPAARTIEPDNSLFVVVSFEGCDPYSQAGGLGVRIAGLVETIADLDFKTHLFFIGDPYLPGEETRHDGRLTLHRWSQWISANCPGGVYDGEAGKVADVSASLPVYLVETVLLPAIAAGKIPMVLFEEWQTAECACRVASLLTAAGVRDRAVLAWNANNPYGFERIDWLRLAGATLITTISRHMRSIIRSCGVDARVIPNGIPEASFEPVRTTDVARIRKALDEQPGAGFLFKMARWEREKGWAQALDAIGHARSRSVSNTHATTPVLIARSGGPTGTGVGLMQDAQARGLRVASFDNERDLLDGLGESVRGGADVVSLRFGVSPTLARSLYAASDGVLANSVSEPFGLVGLEAMAAGGVAFTGGTGEDYAISGRNAVVLETLDPAEIVSRWSELAEAPDLSARLRRSARRTARDYKWRTITAVLIDSLSREARRQGLIARPAPVERAEPKPQPRRQLADVALMPTTRPAWSARTDEVALTGV
ncbi:MAG TPA: glycosyltransferase [Gemmatimonadaceae bacterium]|jgi:glycosyltransferase involved in cell wall biosynthesis